MQNSTRAFLLGPLLKGVSRSFYLTMRVLPAGMRDPVGEAYLLARAADTIADTALISPERRLALLLALRERVNGATRDDTVLAHPVYGELGWLAVVNPGPRTAESVRDLLREAHRMAKRRVDRRTVAGSAE